MPKIIKSADKTSNEKILVTLCVVHQCNNNCLSCIRDENFIKTPNLKLEDISRTIEKLSQKVNTVFITGGEPTLRSDLREILLLIQNKLPHAEIAILSNSRMFSYKEYVKKLFSGLNKNKIYVAAPLYSNKPEVHDNITRVKNSFKQTTMGIENLLKYGIRVEIRVVVNGLNYKTLETTSKFIIKKFKKPFKVTFVSISFVGNAKKNVSEVGVKITDTVFNLERACEMLKREGINVKLYHYPLCVLNKKYFKEAERIAVQKNKVVFLDTCKNCGFKERCCGVWSSYIDEFGPHEFRYMPKNNDFANLQINSSCNQDCLFCLRPPGSQRDPKRSELEKKIIEISKDFNNVIFTGGEPTLRKDLPELVKFAKENGLTHVRLQSNCINISDYPFAKKLKESGLDSVLVSFQSHIPVKLDKIARRKDNFGPTVKGIKNLLKLGVRTEISQVINSINFKDMPNFIEYVHENFIIKNIIFFYVRPIGSAWKNKDIMPKFSDIEPYLKKAIEAGQKKRLEVLVYGVPLCFLNDFEHHSSQIKRFMDGTLYSDYYIADTRKFSEKEYQDYMAKKPEKCNLCTLKAICPGVWKRYVELYGSNELKPSKKSIQTIIKKSENMGTL